MLLTCDFEHICSVYSILLRCLMRQLANTYGVLIVIGYWSLMKWMNNIKFWALHVCYTSLLLWNLVPLGCFFNLSSFENWDAVTCAIASVLFWLPSPQFHQIPSCLGWCAAACIRIILLSKLLQRMSTLCCSKVVLIDTSSLGWGIFSLFFKHNAREPGTMWCFGCRLVFYKVLYTLLYCGPLSLFQMGWWYALPCFRQIGWAFTWSGRSGRSGQCDCIFARCVPKECDSCHTFALCVLHMFLPDSFALCLVFRWALDWTYGF